MIEVGPALAPADVVAVAREGAAVALAPAAREAMERSAHLIARHAGAADPVYGVTTGFGMLATVPIPPSRREQLQRSLVRSHAAGIGEPVEVETVRAMMLLLSLADLRMLLTVADIAAAMSVEALLGTDRVFAADLVALRPQPGQAASASNLRALLAGSPIVASHREGDPRVQDAYSLRCAPQVLGAARDTVEHAERVAANELAAAIDNPMILPDGRVESCGNFHGAPLAFACDFLAIAAAEVGAIAERRTDRMLDPSRSEGLPPFLAANPGVDSGLMIAQYTQAALVAENRRLAAPASVGSLPTSAMQEDYVSMGWGAARRLRTVVRNLARILAIEAVTAARAIELRAPLAPGAGTGAALTALRQAGVSGPGEDRHVAPELAAAEALVLEGGLLRAVAAAIGPLA